MRRRGAISVSPRRPQRRYSPPTDACAPTLRTQGNPFPAMCWRGDGEAERTRRSFLRRAPVETVPCYRSPRRTLALSSSCSLSSEPQSRTHASHMNTQSGPAINRRMAGSAFPQNEQYGASAVGFDPMVTMEYQLYRLPRYPTVPPANPAVPFACTMSRRPCGKKSKYHIGFLDAFP